MKKLIFFDLDDCIVESSPLIQSYLDAKTEFTSDSLEVLETILSSCKDIYARNEKEIERAMRTLKKPNIIGTIKSGSNDVMKDVAGDRIDDDISEKRRFYSWYQRPLEISKLACGKAYWDREKFLEERDHYLEVDNLKMGDDAIVKYEAIYNANNLTDGAVSTIEDVVESNEYEAVYVLSHFNGDREEECKRQFVTSMLPKSLTFLGLRFHLEEYRQGLRRVRSSKALYVMEKFKLANLEDCILIDDSKANLDEWVNFGGKAILYRPQSEDEKFLESLEPHGDRYPRITKMTKDEIDNALKFYGTGYVKRV